MIRFDANIQKIIVAVIALSMIVSVTFLTVKGKMSGDMAFGCFGIIIGMLSKSTLDHKGNSNGN
jgi:hypothetical protein